MQDTPRNSHRPASVTDSFSKAATITAVLFMTLDTFFTIRKGINTFSTGDFLITVVVAFGVGFACAIIQKAVFSVFVNSRSRQIIERIWSAGFIGKVAVVMLSGVAIAAIHFSFSSTSQGLGITPQSLGIDLPGKEYAASLGVVKLLLSAFAGLTVAFIDEILFFCSELLKDG